MADLLVSDHVDGKGTSIISLANVAALALFSGTNLTQTLSRIESRVKGLHCGNCAEVLREASVFPETLAAAAEVKRLAGQINVTIHALGILLCLPHILEPG